MTNKEVLIGSYSEKYMKRESRCVLRSFVKSCLPIIEPS